MWGIARFSALTLLVALTVLGVFAIPAAAAPPTGLTNGDFKSGTLSGWTTFVTGNGTIGTPAVVSFDTTGSGASNAAQFDVGQVTHNFPVYEGGGIYQSVSTTAGSSTCRWTLPRRPICPESINHAATSSFSSIVASSRHTTSAAVRG